MIDDFGVRGHVAHCGESSETGSRRVYNHSSQDGQASLLQQCKRQAAAANLAALVTCCSPQPNHILETPRPF